MVFKTSDEAIGFLSQFLRAHLSFRDTDSERLSWHDEQIIIELFREEIPEAQRYEDFAMDEDVIMVKRGEEASGSNIWLVAPFEGGVVYLSLMDTRHRSDKWAIFTYNFDRGWRNPYNFWGGMNDGFGKQMLYYSLRYTNIKTRTLNYSRSGFQ